MRTRAEHHVDHPPEVVWSYFTDVARWPEWSPFCLAATLDGDQLTMKLRLAGVRLPVRSRIVAREPPHLLAWTTRWPGVDVNHEYRFVARGAGTHMINEEHYVGLPAPLAALVRRVYQWNTPLHASLCALGAGLARATVQSQ